MRRQNSRRNSWSTPRSRTKEPNNPSSHNLRTGILALGLGLAGSVTANAAAVTINNFSFETPVEASDTNFSAPTHSGTSGVATGVFNSWNYALQLGTSFEDFGIENPASTAYTGASVGGTPSGADGTNVVFLNQNNSGKTVSIFQDVGTLQADTTYTLTVAIGQRLDRVNGSLQIGLLNGASGASDIFLTGTLLNSTTGVSSVSGMFQDFTVTFTTGSSVSNDLYVGARYTGDGKVQASLDNFRLDATASAVPEPSTYAALAGVSALMVVALRRRRSNNS